MFMIIPGSCMFVADMLLPEHPSICDEIENSSSVLNITCCFITCVCQKMAVVSVYRSPSTELSVGLYDLRQYLSKLFVITQHVILAGDFNIGVLKDSAARDQYCNLLCDFQLTQLVDSPSRVTEYSSSLVDHVLCTPSVGVSSVAQATGLSDHRVQIADFVVTVQRRTTTSRWVRSFRSCKWDIVKEKLQCIPWSTMEDFEDVEDVWAFFSTVVFTCLNKHFPLRKVSCKYSKHHTPWFSEDIKKAIQQKNKARRVAEHSGNPDDLSLHRKLKNSQKTLVQSAKLEYLQDVLRQSHKSPNMASKLWEQVDGVIGRKKSQKLVVNYPWIK